MSTLLENAPLLGSNSSNIIDEENSRKSSPTPLLSRRNNRSNRHNPREVAVKAAPYGLVALLVFIVSITCIILFLPHNRPEGKHEKEIILPQQLTRNIFAHLKAFEKIAQYYENDTIPTSSIPLYSSKIIKFFNKSMKSNPSISEASTEIFDEEENYAYTTKRPSRSITAGYNASALYIISLLKKNTRCEVKLQYFKVPIWEKIKEAELNVTFLPDNDDDDDDRHKKGTVTYQGGVDFWSMRYGGESATLSKQQVVIIPESGCNENGWDKVKDKIALIQEGGKCDFWKAAYKAEQKGASAVIFYNSPARRTLLYNRVRLVDWKERDPLMKIPVLAASYSLGQLLALSKEIKVDIQTYTKITVTDTFNVICLLRDGPEKENTLVFGAHLDSVPAGAGLVDNASGSATLLEILLAIERADFKPKNDLIFAWWAAEEIGLLGSRHFIREAMMSGEDEKIAMNLNFDMLGSPNYVPFIHKGEDAPSDVRNASIVIQNVFEEYFKAAHESYELIDMLAGSDFLPFLEHGIPSGMMHFISGVLTGAGGRKTEDQRHTFGGFANAPFDPCYHQACDTLENVSEEAIGVTSQAALYAITKFAKKENGITSSRTEVW
ncbi:hypothetical protein G9A89_012576 [Geosiphon pyriformis]|nr:hypothetical protein G9A89_012576 [Geosiphon pyriformis]